MFESLGSGDRKSNALHICSVYHVANSEQSLDVGKNDLGTGLMDDESRYDYDHCSHFTLREINTLLYYKP